MSESETEQQDVCRFLAEAEGSLPASFERLAKRYRLRTAVGSGVWRPTYEELNASANRLAHALLLRGGGRGDRVALVMRHDTPLIAAVLSVLKAGRIVVVLNPTDPPARLQRLVDDAEPSLILTDSANRELAAAIAGRTCGIAGVDDQTAEGPAHNPELEIRPEDTAFLIYTSGSTGYPTATRQEPFATGYRWFGRGWRQRRRAPRSRTKN